MADLEPARYFNLAIKQIKEAVEWMKSAEDASQPLLVHLDILVYLSKKYPEMANERIENLDRKQTKEVFYNWFERCEKKIPAKFREGIKQSADQLFSSLEQI